MYIHHSLLKVLIAPVLFVAFGLSLFWWMKMTRPLVANPRATMSETGIVGTSTQIDKGILPDAQGYIPGIDLEGIPTQPAAGTVAVTTTMVGSSTASTTMHMSVMLDVPLYYQLRPLSCEIASLRMALAGKGVTVMEKDIFNLIGIDDRPRDAVNNMWGDPDKIFVGNIDGSQNTTGYGVHWDPIAIAAQQWRGNSEAFTNGTLEFVREELKKGNPVVTWGLTGRYKTSDSWTTYDGRVINTWRGEHARVLVGFEGNPDDPEIYIFKDPNEGILRWTKQQFLEDWAKFDYSGVVVR